jgi:hypothetical protein
MNWFFFSVLCGFAVCRGNEVLLNDQIDSSTPFQITNNFSYSVIIEYDDGLMGSFMVTLLPLRYLTYFFTKQNLRLKYYQRIQFLSMFIRIIVFLSKRSEVI